MISKGDIVKLRQDIQIGEQYGRLKASPVSCRYTKCPMIVTGDNLHHDMVNCRVLEPSGMMHAFCYTREMLVPCEVNEEVERKLKKFL